MTLSAVRCSLAAVRRSEAGLSLVETTIILTVLATLTAALSPAIATYVDQARQARTRQDVQVIGEAIQTFIDDNGEVMFLRNGSNGASDETPPTRISNRVDLLVSDGDIPTLATSVSTESFWTQTVNLAEVDTLSNHLVENQPGNSDTQRYRTPADIIVSGGGNNIDFTSADSAGYNAPYAWRGAYLRGPVSADPWGNRYAVNVGFLDPRASTSISGISGTCSYPTDYPKADVFVLSAGPDQEVDTPSCQDGAKPGDNDVIFVVSGHAK